MTVFKGFLIITKRNLLMVFMYLAIFLTIGILASGSDSLFPVFVLPPTERVAATFPAQLSALFQE